MRAVEIIHPGPAGELALIEAATPTPASREVLIRVAYAGLNRADILQRRGQYPLPGGERHIPGLEVAGEITAVGPDVKGWNIGDHVCALLNEGGYAEYARAPYTQLLPVPRHCDLRDAAVIPEALFTLWSALFDGGRLQPGERLLIHGGASGIGTTAIQLARLWECEVIATAGTDEKCRACTDLGAHFAVNYTTQDFLSEIKTITGGDGVDVILDIAGGDAMQKNLELLRVKGRLVSIAFMNGAKANLNMAPLLLKRLSWVGSVLRSRTVEEKAHIARAVREILWPLVEGGVFKPVIDSEFPLENAEKAQKRMEEGLNIGKIALKIMPS